MTSLMNLFGRSPVGPMQHHMEQAHRCAEQLTPFFKAVLANDWEQVEQVREAITTLEHEADVTKKEIRLSLPKSLFLAVPRTDLLELLTMQDRIANKAKDISGIMLGRKMEIPESMAQGVLDYVQAAIDTSAQAKKAMNELDELVETGFGGREVNIVEDMISKLDDLEHKTDEIQIKVRAELFSLEANLPPVNVMFLYKVIDLIGELADFAERVGSRLQYIIAR